MAAAPHPSAVTPGSAGSVPAGAGAAAPERDADERRDNMVFDALLRALVRPGEVRAMPEPGPEPIARALVDRECRAFAPDPALTAVLRELGAVTAAVEEADHVFLDLADEAGLATFARLPVGDPLHPERGATVVAGARLGQGAALHLAGPGIEGTREVRIGGLHPGLWDARARVCRYPLGIELIFVDGPRLMALPRSTQVEVL